MAGFTAYHYKQFASFFRTCDIVMDTTPGCGDYNSNREGINGDASCNKNRTDTKLVVRVTRLQQFSS